MARAMPVSLSPHICTLTSPDLDELLESASLPPLPHLLQSFSPLSQVTTRTTSLASVQHPTFHLRFSDLTAIERACAEDAERRALRTLDWITARIQRRCAAWVADVEAPKQQPKRDAPSSVQGGDAGAGAGIRVVDDLKDPEKANSTAEEKRSTPWWDELRACVEGVAVPSREEGWNHPAAVILAVSTTGINPLQAVKNLHSRQSELPSWVDPTHLRFTLIVHPRNSPLSDEVANALLNAVKREHGLHCYLLPLDLQTDPLPAPVPAPPLPPQLPNPDSEDEQLPPPSPITLLQPVLDDINEITMDPQDIKETAKFVREFTVQSLIPWMERHVLEWNEVFTSTRRLPSRLFSSTRRLFGSGYGSASTPSPPAPARSSSVAISSSSVAQSIGGGSGNTTGSGSVVGQQRRLAEFATILGDVKLAVSVWEALRKDGKGGSDILPLLLAPGPGVPLHAQYALATQGTGEGTSSNDDDNEQRPETVLRSVTLAVRWEVGIDQKDFVGNVLEGERWLVWAASNAEEAPSALLLAHAAHLSAGKYARRRAALWYLIAANRLEKCGIKPLTMHFLRRAQTLYHFKEEKGLSPSFWDADDRTPEQWVGFEAIRPGIEAALGRLLYTTGDIDGAVRVFLQLLKPSSEATSTTSYPGTGAIEAKHTDQVILEDFNVAFKHFLATDGDRRKLADLKLAASFSLPRLSRVRIPRESSSEDANVWASREEEWSTFWKSRGSESLAPGGKARVNETFWFDLVVRNPLAADVRLANLSLRVRPKGNESSDYPPEFVKVEVIDEISLDAHETRTIPIALTAQQSVSLLITHATYDFLGLFPCTDSLAVRGKRLHDTPLQRQTKTYAPDVLIGVDIEEVSQRLSIDFIDDEPLYLLHGENKCLQLRLANDGLGSIDEAWMVTGPETLVWIDGQTSSKDLKPVDSSDVLRSSNSLRQPIPTNIPLGERASLSPNTEVPLKIVLNASYVASDANLYFLFVYREAGGKIFRSVRVKRPYEVDPLLSVSVSARPSRSTDRLFTLGIDIDHVGEAGDVRIMQVVTLSPSWKSTSLVKQHLPTVHPQQVARLVLGVTSWSDGIGRNETEKFAVGRLQDVLQGRQLDQAEPPSIDLISSHMFGDEGSKLPDFETCFLHEAKRAFTARALSLTNPHIPSSTHSHIFPLYHPSDVDVIISWSIPSQDRHGIMLASTLQVGAGHAALREVLLAADAAGGGRSMYAETQREKGEMIESVRASAWNKETNPIVVNAEDAAVEHSFQDGPCTAPALFTLRNCSLTHPCRYVFKLLPAPQISPSSSELLLPDFTSRQTFRGTLDSTTSVVVRAKITAARPGLYTLAQWSLEVEVGEPGQAEWQARSRYLYTATRQDAGHIRITDIQH